MGKMTELTIQIENKPGTLASLGKIMAKAKVNILAFVADEAGEYNRVRLVTDSSAKAKEVFEGLKLPVSEAEVIGIVLKNKPGTLARAARKLASADININYSYSGAKEGSRRQIVVLGVSDVKKAAKALKKG
jgi:hypothetical protein